MAQAKEVTPEEVKKFLEAVSMFIRNLPKCQHASPEKIRMANELGITLEDGQTLVNSFSRTRTVRKAA